MTLPLKPPIKPQLAKSARELPEGDQWRYEVKWDELQRVHMQNVAGYSHVPVRVLR